MFVNYGSSHFCYGCEINIGGRYEIIEIYCDLYDCGAARAG